MKIYLEQLEQLERLPEDHFCFDPVTGTPEVPISSRKPRLRFISFHPRNHQKFVCDSLSSLNSSTHIPLLEFSSNLCLAELKAFYNCGVNL